MKSSRILQLATRRVITPTPKVLPPLPLYRRILRAHMKHLDSKSRRLGDEYVKGEFKQHRTIDNPVQIVGFLTSWQKYCEALEGNTWREEKLDAKQLANMSEEQVTQLYELMLAAKDKPSSVDS